MRVFDVFSKRKKRNTEELPDLYQYDNIPSNLRVQIVHILDDVSGEDYINSRTTTELFKSVHNILSREIGVLKLPTLFHDLYKKAVLNFILSEKNVEYVIDAIELTLRLVERMTEYQNRAFLTAKINPEEAIQELNYRFKENGIGFQYESGNIIKLDNNFSHIKMIKPTIQLLSSKRFKGASEEFHKAIEHYAKGRNKECLSECLEAFESTMKIICKERGWYYEQNWTAQKLIDTCLKNDLIPTFLQSQLTSLGQLFISGVPTIRNRLGGHGQGDEVQTVDDRLTKYCINLTASNILFFIEQSGLK